MHRTHSWTSRDRVAARLLFTILIPLTGYAQGDRVSRLGQYRGYSSPMYDQWVRQSRYITVRDGTNLAADIFRPVTRGGRPVEDPLPIIWTHDRYQRASFRDDNSINTQIDWNPWLETVLQYGYIVAAVDVRGGGASFGVHTGPLSPEETRDAYDITEWLADQPWSNGRIGMYGRSYLGMTQYMAASTKPPHLVAIFPEMALFDSYSFIYPGGVYQRNFFIEWGSGVERLDQSLSRRVVPVDEDLDGAMLEAALLDHLSNTDIYEWTVNAPFRDSLVQHESMTYPQNSPSTYVQEVIDSGVAVYHLAGWFDIATRDALVWYKNLEPNSPQKLVVGPWSHSSGDREELTAEHLRWYDYWLKGIENGIMDEAPIHYYTMGAASGEEWRSTEAWPLTNQELMTFYFDEGPSGSISSVNDGYLSLRSPDDIEAYDIYTVDYSTTTGRKTRWTNGYGGGFEYPDMSANDQKGLTYTTAPLTEDVEITGHPVVHLWVSASVADIDLFVYLEEIDEPQGAPRSRTFHSHYITEGVLRASHRKLGTAPYAYLDLPYHRSFAEDVNVLLVDEPLELVFDLHPTSNVFDKGHRIRVTVTCADRDNMEVIALSPPPTATVHRNANYKSYIVLPVIPTDYGARVPD